MSNLDSLSLFADYSVVRRRDNNAGLLEALCWILTRSEQLTWKFLDWQCELELCTERHLSAAEIWQHVRAEDSRTYTATDPSQDQAISSFTDALYLGEVLATGRPGEQAVRVEIPVMQWADLQIPTWGGIPAEDGVHAVLRSGVLASGPVAYYDLLFDMKSLISRYPPRRVGDARPCPKSLTPKPSLKMFVTDPEQERIARERLQARGKLVSQRAIAQELAEVHEESGWGPAKSTSIEFYRRRQRRVLRAEKANKNQNGKRLGR